jgi:hypothetical protein
MSLEESARARGEKGPGEFSDSEETPDLFYLAFKRVEAEIMSVESDQVPLIDFDPRAVVSTILGAYPEIIALRPQLELLTPEIAKLDNLRDYALALGHAHARYAQALGANDDLVELTTEGRGLCERLQAAATNLSSLGWLTPSALTDRASDDDTNIALGLQLLAESLLACWSELADKTDLRRAEVEHAQFVARRILVLRERREQAPVRRERSSLLRQRAYALCATTYAEARSALALLGYGNAELEAIAPSLSFAGEARDLGSEAPGAPEAPEVNTESRNLTARSRGPTRNE